MRKVKKKLKAGTYVGDEVLSKRFMKVIGEMRVMCDPAIRKHNKPTEGTE